MKINLSLTGILVTILAALAITAAVVSWYRPQAVVSVKEYVKVPEIRTVEKIKRVEVPVEKVIVLEKTSVSEKIELPEEIKRDDAKQITSTAEIESYDGKTNVVSVIDKDTGETTILAKQEQLPLIDFENHKEIGIRYGYATKTNRQADIYGRWDFLRVGNVHLGVYAEANTDGDAKAMVAVSYKW